MKPLNPSLSKVDLWYKSFAKKSGVIQRHDVAQSHCSNKSITALKSRLFVSVCAIHEVIQNQKSS